MNDGRAPLDTVLATGEFVSRGTRAPDREAELRAATQLVLEMQQPSRHVLQRLADILLEVCRAGSAGVSLLEEHDGAQRFRWHALAGGLREHLWGVTPRHLSACSLVVDEDAPQLFREPGRHFQYLREVQPQIAEGLLVPFHVGGRTTGAVWVADHTGTRHFDAEDARLATQLATIAGAVYHADEVIEAERAAARHKDEFLAVLSHEMRSPLAAISNSARYLAAAGAADPALQHAGAMIERQLAHVTRLSEDLLDASRVGQGTLELRMERTDLVSAVRAGHEAAIPALDEYDRDITVTLPETPLFVHGDPVRLSQVVTNLLTNAARRTRSGGRVVLTMRRDGADVVIQVTSDTEGMATGWTGAPGGTGRSRRGGEPAGIGITLARSFVELHGGRIIPVGTDALPDCAFDVRLPALDPASAAPRERRDSGSTRRVREPGRRRERVLVVDDSVDAGDSLALLLQSWGHDVRTAQGAVAGLRLEWEFEPHAVILDIDMPGKNGYEVAAELRVRRRELLLVALSGFVREEDRARSLAAGFDYHLTKPADVELLQRILS